MSTYVALPDHASGHNSPFEPVPISWSNLPRDASIMFLTRCMRMFNYGSIAPVFFLYCVAIGIDVQDTGILLTCILVGDLFITLFLSTRADRTIGRKRTLIVGALLKVAAGIGFALTRNFAVLVGTGIIGVISTSGGEIGPFVAIEQAIVTDSVVNAGGSKSDVPILFGYYNAFGYFFQALGALASGLTVHLLQKYTSFSDLDAYRFVFYSYALFGIFMAFAYSLLSSNAEIAELNENTALKQSSTPTTTQPTLPASSQGCFDFGLRRPESKFIVVRLSIMFMLDAFAGAFVMQTWIAFWFERKFEFSADLIGYLLMASNVVSGISGIAASYVVQKVGAMLTMIITHLPSNILLIGVPLMPTSTWAAIMLVCRFCISQMDVPARQAYVAMVVAPDERSAAGGMTNLIRSLGSALGPILLGHLSSSPVHSWKFNSPWYIAGGLKIVYDVTLYGMYVFGSAFKETEASAARKDEEEKLHKK